MRTQLLNDIRTELTRLSASSNVFATRTAVDKIYEVYILSCVIKSLNILGCILEARDNNDKPTTNFDFRLSPSTSIRQQQIVLSFTLHTIITNTNYIMA